MIAAVITSFGLYFSRTSLSSKPQAFRPSRTAIITFAESRPRKFNIFHYLELVGNGKLEGKKITIARTY
jgi:hypothetical protein